MRAQRGEQSQLKRELFAMPLYARTGRTGRNVSVRFRATHPIFEHRVAGQEFTRQRRSVKHESVPLAPNFSSAIKFAKEGHLAVKQAHLVASQITCTPSPRTR